VQRVDFVSDLHLSTALPKTQAAFAQYLLSTPADRVVILGDLFEVWVGDDAGADPWEHGFAAMMSAAAQRVPIQFMAGNRDFLVGPAWLRACAMTALPDPCPLDLFGETVLLTHGDALCLDDQPYQQFRAMVRSPAWQAQFLVKPLAERRAIAAQIRSESRSRRSFDGAMNADLDAAACLSWLQEHRATTLLHGHTHRPAEHRLSSAHRRIVLSDWDLDDTSRPRAEVLAWTAAGPQRIRLS
jgi:UDP-2,3-diacylglucosamine hydrolase